MSSYIIPPALHAIIANADNIAPGRSTASDGTIGDAAHRAEVSDHNPDPGTGIVHAVDITNDPAHGMDTWQWANRIASRIVAGSETRVKYLVSNDGTQDVIFNPSIGKLFWRPNLDAAGNSQHDHASHLHTSILYTLGAENDVRPYFVKTAAPVPPPPPLPIEEMPGMFVLNGEAHRFAPGPSGDLWHQWGAHGAENLSAALRAKHPAYNTKVNRTEPVEFIKDPDPARNGVVWGQWVNPDGYLMSAVYFGGWDVAAYKLT